MRHALVGAVAATTLLLGWAGSAAAQNAPPKPGDKPAEAKKEAAPKAPPKAPAPSAPGRSVMDWNTATEGFLGNPRRTLADKGIDLGVRYTNDWTHVQRGGANPHKDADRYWLDASVTLDLKKLAKVPCGGTIFASYWQMGGENGTKDLGSFNNMSTIEAEFRQQLAELYYSNSFLKEAFDTRVGKMDPTERFNHSEYTGDFMNNASDFAATYFPSPRFPETAFGGDLFYRSKGLYAGAGLFDGSKQEGIETGHGGVRHFFREPGDLYMVGEAGYRWTDGNRPVRAAVGAWKHTGDFPGLSGHVFDRSSGWYALAEGMLVRTNREDPKDARGAYLVLRYGSMEPSTTAVDWTTTAAVVWRGTFASRKNDSVGLAWSISSVTSEDPGLIRYSSEQVVEFYYKAQVTPFLSIAPGVQYIANPGGTFNDALVFGVRAVLDF